jgi:hypothetical protein
VIKEKICHQMRQTSQYIQQFQEEVSEGRQQCTRRTALIALLWRLTCTPSAQCRKAVSSILASFADSAAMSLHSRMTCWHKRNMYSSNASISSCFRSFESCAACCQLLRTRCLVHSTP